MVVPAHSVYRTQSLSHLYCHTGSLIRSFRNHSPLYSCSRALERSKGESERTSALTSRKDKSTCKRMNTPRACTTQFVCLCLSALTLSAQIGGGCSHSAQRMRATPGSAHTALAFEHDKGAERRERLKRDRNGVCCARELTTYSLLSLFSPLLEMGAPSNN